MKKIKELLFLLFGLLLLPFWGASQTHLVNKGGHVVSGDAFLVLKNSHLTNNGTISHTKGTVKLSGDAVDANSTIGGNSTSTFYQLEVHKTANNVLLAKSITVSSTLALNGGHLDIQNADLTAQTITGAMASRYIKTSGSGQLLKQVSNSEVTFPIGNSSFNPAKISNTGAIDLIGLKVEDQVLRMATTGAAITTASVDRTWHLTESTAGGSNLNINLQWNAAEELTDFDRSQATFAAFETGQWADKNSGAASGTNPYAFTGTGITVAGAFTVGNLVCESTPTATLSFVPPTAGAITGIAALCLGSNTSLTAHPSGGTGSYSTVFSSSNTGVAGINSSNGLVNTLTSGATNISYLVTDAKGCKTTSADFALEVASLSVGGTIAGAATVCSGANLANLTLGAQTGQVINWQSSEEADFGSITDITSTNTTLSPQDLTATTYYRAVVQSGACAAVLSDISTITVDNTDANNDNIPDCQGDCTADVSVMGVFGSPIATGVYQAGVTIESGGYIESGSEVEFKAGQSITLVDGFHAQAGSNFIAKIETCMVSLIENEEIIAQSRISLPTALSEQPLSLKVFPNPMKYQAQVYFRLPLASKVSVQLFDQSGRLIQQVLQAQKRTAGDYYVRFNSDQLYGGLFYVVLQSDTERLVQKLVVLGEGL